MKTIEYEVLLNDGTKATVKGWAFSYRGEDFAISSDNIITHLKTGKAVWHEKHNVGVLVYQRTECIEFFKKAAGALSDEGFKEALSSASN